MKRLRNRPARDATAAAPFAPNARNPRSRRAPAASLPHHRRLARAASRRASAREARCPVARGAPGPTRGTQRSRRLRHRPNSRDTKSAPAEGPRAASVFQNSTAQSGWRTSTASELPLRSSARKTSVVATPCALQRVGQRFAETFAVREDQRRLGRHRFSIRDGWLRLPGEAVKLPLPLPRLRRGGIDREQFQPLHLREHRAGRIEQREIAEVRIFPMLHEPQMRVELGRQRREDLQLAQRHDDHRAPVLTATQARSWSGNNCRAPADRAGNPTTPRSRRSSGCRRARLRPFAGGANAVRGTSDRKPGRCRRAAGRARRGRARSCRRRGSRRDCSAAERAIGRGDKFLPPEFPTRPRSPVAG